MTLDLTLCKTMAAVTSGLLTIVKTGITIVSYFDDVTATLFALTIDGFHSRDLQSCGTQMTKVVAAMLVHITKDVH